jgi:hypothetical protein
MRFPGFIGPSYTLDSVNVDCQRCMNLFPEIDEQGTGKEQEVAALVRTPGLRTLLTLPTGPVRGEWAASNGTLYVVSGNKLYEVSSLWVATVRGTLNTSSGPVSMDDNGSQLVIVDGSNGYICTMATGATAQITDPDFPGATQVTFQDGYFIFVKPNSEQFFISAINDGTNYDALDIATPEGAPDNLIGAMSDHQNVFLFGTESTEIFYDSGNADFPFERNQGALIEVGCAAAFSIAKLGNVPYWLGQDKQGRGIVYRAQGFQPQRISTHAIEGVITGLGDLSTARAWTYQEKGHGFYALNLPGAESTWVYDSSTGLWHERSFLNQGRYERHRAECHAFAYNTHVVGDYSSGKLYALDRNTFSDAGAAIARERTAPHVAQGMKRQFHERFDLDIETGVGIDGAGQGTDPQVMMQWSDDHGRTWSQERWRSIGKIGERKKRVYWNRLGSSYDRVYRVRITDPVKVTLLGADLTFSGGAA